MAVVKGGGRAILSLNTTELVGMGNLLKEAGARLGRVGFKDALKAMGMYGRDEIRKGLAKGEAMGVPFEGLSEKTLGGKVSKLVGGVETYPWKRKKRRAFGTTPLSATNTHIMPFVKSWQEPGDSKAVFIGIKDTAPEKARKVAAGHQTGAGGNKQREWLALGDAQTAMMSKIAGQRIFRYLETRIARKALPVPTEGD